MHKLSEGFDRLCADNQNFKMLFTLARSHDPYIPTASASRASYKASLGAIPEADRPAWTNHFLGDEKKSFYAIVKELNLPPSTFQECWGHVSRWLRRVLYETSIFLPNITEETAHNMALGHPIAIWLTEYVDILDATCSVGMVAWKSFNSDMSSLPPALIRLPQLVIRFRTILLPVIRGFHKESLKELKELRSEYVGE